MKRKDRPMRSIVLVSPLLDRWQEFAHALKAGIQVGIINARSGNEALEAARTANPVAMAIDVQLGDMSGVDLVKRLLRLNAMINIALASDEPEEHFHAKTEGLGILMKLSSIPNSAEAAGLIACLRQVTELP
ncbi:MAG: response regulator [Desulfobacteraceae bacterium]|nr:MAG: response regulator [Desulfobacteraceae bacterium]